MFTALTLIDPPNGNLFFGYMSETQVVLVSGVFLVILTVGIRWIMRKHESDAEKGKVKR
jgi:hypothetical protein